MILNHIYNGNTLDILETIPSDSIDITVTSPPYNKMGAKGGLVDEVNYKNSDDKQDEFSYQLNQMWVLNELYRITKPFGHIFYNHKLRWIKGKMIHPYQWVVDSYWNIRQEIVWDRQIAAQLRGWRFWQTEERIYWMQKGLIEGEELLSKHSKLTSIWKIRPETKMKGHPAPFPLALPTRCIYSILNETQGKTILDPYCGVGTTLLAAHILKHNYIGIDCCEDYIKIAEDRIKNCSSVDIQTVAQEINLHKVNKTYKEIKAKKTRRFRRADNI
jgi:modification methylase